MKISKILFVSAFEELWLDALQSLMALRKAGMNNVVFLHVISKDKVAMRRGAGYLKQEERKLKEIADIRFIDWAETLFEDKRAKFEELYAGSETSELLRRADKPVLIYNYLSQSGKVGENPFERLLLGLDWSVSSEKVLDYVLALRGATKRVDIVHVMSEKDVAKISKMEAQKLERNNKKRLDEVCDVLVNEKFDARPHLYIGKVEDQIQKAASEHRTTMIVVGAKRRSIWKEKWSGSAAHSLADTSELPVLIVPTEVK